MDAPTDAGPPPGVPSGPPPGGPSAPPPGAPTGPRRLRRRPDDGHIAGVCAGVAEYFNVDPVIVRIAAVVLLFSGPGAFAYVLAWIFVPEASGPATYGGVQAPIDRKDRGTQVFGIVLIALAVSVFWGDWWSPARHWLLPLGLMALGAWLLLRRDEDDDAVGPPPVPPSTPSAPTRAWATDTGSDAALAADVDPTAVATATGAVGGAGDEPPTAPWHVPPVPPGAPVPPVPPARRGRRRLVGPIVFGVLLVWTGLAFLFDVSVQHGLAVGLLIIGVGFILGAFVGGSRVLIMPAFVVGAALVVTGTLDIPLSGPVGEQRWAPERLVDLEDAYEVSLGEGTLDLSAIQIPEDDRILLDASVGMGHLVVLVPDGMTVDVTTDVGAGESNVLDRRQNGVGVTSELRDEGDADSGTLVLDLQVGLGQIEVRRVDADPSEAPATTSTTVLG